MKNKFYKALLSKNQNIEKTREKKSEKVKKSKSKIKTSDTAILFKIMTEKEAEQNISSEESVEENLDSDEEVILIYF